MTTESGAINEATKYFKQDKDSDRHHMLPHNTCNALQHPGIPGQFILRNILRFVGQSTFTSMNYKRKARWEVLTNHSSGELFDIHQSGDLAFLITSLLANFDQNIYILICCLPSLPQIFGSDGPLS